MDETRRLSKETAGLEYRADTQFRRLSKSAAMVEAQWSTQFDGMLKDNLLSGPVKTTNYGADTTAKIGWFTGYADPYRYALSFTTSLPPNAVVFNSTLRLYFAAPTGAAVNFRVYRMTSTDWVEAQATWNIKATGTNWTAPGGDYDSSVYGYATAPAAAGVLEVDITAVIQAAVAAKQTVIGLLCIPDAAVGTKYNTVSTKDNATAANRPIVRIDYGTNVNYRRLSAVTSGSEWRAELFGDADWRSDITRRRLSDMAVMVEYREANMFASNHRLTGRTMRGIYRGVG